MHVLRGLVMVGLLGGITLGGCNCNNPDTTEDAGASGNMGSSGSTSGASGQSSGGASNGGLSSSGASNGGLSSGGASNGGLSSGGASNGGLSSGGASNGGLSSGGASNGGLSSGGASNGGLSSGGASSGLVVALSITRMIPTAGYRGEDTVVQLLGTGFVDAATVTFTHRDDPSQVGGTFNIAGVMTGAGTTLNVLLPADMARPLGLYTVVVSQGGAMAQAPELFRVTLAPPPTITDVTPAFAFSGNPTDGVLSDRVLTLTGTGFRTGAVVEFQAADSANALLFEGTDTAVESVGTISATIPSESQSMPLGRYFVTVTNPDGQVGSWLVNVSSDGGVVLRRGTVEVRDVPPPRVTAIEPSRPTVSTASPLTVRGENFLPGATVALVAPDGTECPATSTTAPSGQEGMTVVAVLDVGAAEPCGLSQGDYFLVRVTNPDGQFADFSSLHMYSNTTGKLTDFTVATGNPLQSGRARHDSTVFFDDVCGASLVLAGGEGARGGAAVAPLTDIERATITPFGELGGFTQLYTANDQGQRILNRLVQPRLGAQVSNLGNWVFVLGGMDAAGTATNTAERATILTRATAVGAGFAEPAGNGFLPQGRFHYRVSAVLPDGERFSGEGLASRSVNAVANPDGSVALTFESYPAAVGYRVYRSVAPGAGPGLVGLIAAGAVGTPVAGMTGLLRLVDNGDGLAGSAPGNVGAVGSTVGGSLPSGFYGYRVSAVRMFNGMPLESPAGAAVVAQAMNSMQQVSLAWDPVPGANAYRIYRTSSQGLTGTPQDANRAVARLAEVTTTTHLDDGSVALTAERPVDPETPLPRGSLGRFSLDPQSNLAVARQGHEVARVPLGSTWPEIRLYAVGGRDGRTGTTLASAEHGQLSATGHITWTAMTFNSASVDLAVPRANFVLGSNAGSRDALGCASNPAPPDPCDNPDRDGDGFRSVMCGGTDCDDTRPDVNLNAPEICTDGIDNDCDTLVDGADPECVQPDAGMPPGDAGSPPADAGNMPGDSGVAPGDAGMPGQDSGFVDSGNPPMDAGGVADAGMVGVDAGTPDAAVDPCRFLSFADSDGDGFRKTQCGGTDCDDTNPNINPGVFESPLVGDGMCQNGVDEDCNGTDSFCVSGAFPSGAWAQTGPEEIYLLATAGSSAVNGTAETVIPLRSAGTPYGEVAFVRPDGTIEEWLPVLAPNGFGASGVGAEGLFYFNYLYMFGGSDQGGGQHIDRTTTCLPTSDDLPNFAPDCGVVPNGPLWSSVDDLLSNQDSTAQGMTTNRVFFSSERAFSRVFVLGGYNAVNGTLLQSHESASE